MHVDLKTATPDAAIYYTLDGSEPTRDSLCYRAEEGYIKIPANSDRDKSVCTDTLIRAFAVKEGWEDSEIVDFSYHIVMPPRTAYTYRVLQQKPGKPQIILVQDFDRDKMYLILGEKRGLFIDLGNDPDGDLKSLVDLLAGGLPWEAIVLHGHPDHIQQGHRMVDAGIAVYMNEKDNDLARSFGFEPEGFQNIEEGHVFDLGGCSLSVFALPGHTPGGLVLVDEETGDIFSSDGLGCNIALAPGSGWLQFGNPESAMDRYLSAIQSLRCKIADYPNGRIYNGHDDNILDANLYLNNLEKAVQRAVDEGEAGLFPTLRPAVDSFGSEKIALEGDATVDTHYAAINIGLLFTEGLNEKNNALLSYVDMKQVKCKPAFDPYVEEYLVENEEDVLSICPISSSTKSRLFVNGELRSSKEWMMVELPVAIQVEAPDGKTIKTYHFKRADKF